MDTQSRSIAKTISFRIFATVATTVLVYVITGNLALAGFVGILDSMIKLIIYYLHERFWDRVSWGRKIDK
jgi:adenylylsulfate kinase